jgi:RNA polymerase sigma-70 factor (ECF subfamily)
MTCGGVADLSTSEVEAELDLVRDRRGGGTPEEDRRDEELIRAAVVRARGGDTEAIRLLYTRFAPDVFRWVRHMLREPHEAEDVTQTVFLKLISVIPQYEERTDVPFAAWLRKVARNAALDHIRANQALPVEDLELHCDGGRGDRERARALRQALAGLPQDQREVVLLRHIRGLSPLEIAAILGKSESAVHGLHHRGRHNLQSSLTKLGLEPVVANPSAP